MIDHRSSQYPATAASGTLFASMTPLPHGLRSVRHAKALHFPTLIEYLGRLLFTVLALVLLVPAMLVLALLVIGLARGLGVALYAPSRRHGP